MFATVRHRTVRTKGALSPVGELSFSIYLVHVPVWFALESGLRAGAFANLPWLLPDASAAMPVMVSPFGSALGADGLVLVYVGLVIAIAAWTHRRIEEPARHWSRRLADRVGPFPIPSIAALPAFQTPPGLVVSPAITRSRTLRN